MLLDPPPPPPPDGGGANGLENSVESSSSSSMCTVVAVVVSCKDPPHAPPPSPPPVCWNGFPLLLIFLHGRIYKERARENRERSTNVSLQRSSSSRERFNFSKSLSLHAKISPLSVHLSSSSKTPPRRETFVSVKSVVVLCEPARVCVCCVCVCLLRYIKIAKKILSSSFPPKLCFSLLKE